jgi:hypothetical protein
LPYILTAKNVEVSCFLQESHNKALHRIPHAVVLFEKKRKKARQHAPPVNAALGVCDAKIQGTNN